MARKVFISVLGTNKYLEARYYFGSKPSGNEEALRFVQEKTIKEYCEKWGDKDKILIFLTNEAKGKNWIEAAHNGEYEGLSKRLSMLKLKCPVKGIDIPEGLDEDEIWQIFSTVFYQLEDGDELYFDITHSFRMLPMVIMVLINYAKFLKSGITVKSITYGAFEKLGPTYKVKEIPLEQRWVQILELKQLSVLQDYTNAANEFVKHGAVKSLSDLFPDSGFSFALNSFSDAFSGCRGIDVFEAESASLLKKEVENLDDNIHPAQRPIIEKIKNKVDYFRSGEIVQNGIAGVVYCIDHGLVQQAITLLSELMVTYVLAYLQYDWKLKFNRDICSSALSKFNKEGYNADLVLQKYRRQVEAGKLSGSDYLELEKRLNDLIEKIYNLEFKEVLTKDIYSCLQIGTRDDINHAGIRDKSKSTKKLEESLLKYYNLFKNIIIAKYPISDAPKPI